MSQANFQADGYQKHATNTRIYVMYALGSKWHIIKHGHGRKRTLTGKLGKSTKRFVAFEQITRGRVLAHNTLHELVNALQAAHQMQAAQQALFA